MSRMEAKTCPSPVGIDALSVHVPDTFLSLDELAEARGVPPEKISVGLGSFEMAVTPPWEDTVTIAANAAEKPLRLGQVDPGEIGLLVVGTETAVDHAKPVATFLHELLGLPSACRTFEVKHACYGGTAGVTLAADWVRSPSSRGRKALVVAADIARYDLGSSPEFTQGAGAAAMVISRDPRLLEIDPRGGTFTRNVYDFWRPLDRREALVDGKFSIDCYLDALSGATADFAAAHDLAETSSLLDRFEAMLYHTPFPKMGMKAHRRFAEATGRAADAADTARRLVEPWLEMSRRVGNSYTASLYLGLAWLASTGGRLDGREISLFSYGSGCCAEFFTGRFAPGSHEVGRTIDAAGLLARRSRLSVEEYERFSRAKPGESPGAGPASGFFLARLKDDRRLYERAGASGVVAA